MKPYAEDPARRARQVAGDVGALTWLLAGSLLARETQERLLALQEPGRRLESSGTQLSGTFSTAADTASRVPLVGDELSTALGTGTTAGDSVAGAGTDLVGGVGMLATGAALLVVALALLPVLLWYLPLRWRYARTAGEAADVRASGPDLLALQALVQLPTRQLLAVCPDPAGAWRAGDRPVCGRLAELRLAQLGLRPRGTGTAPLLRPRT